VTWLIRDLLDTGIGPAQFQPLFLFNLKKKIGLTVFKPCNTYRFNHVYIMNALKAPYLSYTFSTAMDMSPASPNM
jgi:hypothetical protein